MKVNKAIKIKAFKFKDMFNVNYEPYYQITNGKFKFFDKITQYKFMFLYGIMCECIIKRINGKIVPTYYGKPVTEEQKEFIRKRSIALSTTVPKGVEFIKHNCGCKKNANQKT